ncbi:alpha/beta hydrolase [Kistimonas asteriae]|uniref:alpha/beta hydrolase n=1 Tax=Kistimonas asteriae TaxID=517724 RepID=UPI001BA50407|nr:YqiA/YcfP family alpha/beta fold hydrolase [Kistimonas asteriae]
MKMAPIARAESLNTLSSSNSQIAFESGVVEHPVRRRSPYIQGVITGIRSLPETFGKMVSHCAKPPGKPLQKRKVALLCFTVPMAVTFSPFTLAFTMVKSIQDMIFFPRQQRFSEVYALTDDTASRETNAHLDEGTLRISHELIEIQNDQQHLKGWLFRTEHPTPSGVILFFHSNNMTATGAANHFARLYTDRKFHCIFTEYPGYGDSEGGIYSDHDIKLAATAFYERAVELYGNSNLPFFVYGSSIGTVPAMYLTARRDIKKVVLDAPFRDFIHLAKTRGKCIPGCLIQYHISTQHNLKRFLQRNNTKALILHATGDNMIPYEESAQLIAPYKNKTQFFHRAVLHTAGGIFSYYSDHNELNSEDNNQILGFLSSGVS